MPDDIQETKLTPEQECIMTLAAIIGAVHFESSDPITQQFVTMMVSKVAQEYQQNSNDPLSVAIFTPKGMIALFRDSMAKMRTGLADIQRQQDIAEKRSTIISPNISKNGKKKHD